MIFDQFKKGEVALNFGDLALGMFDNLEYSRGYVSQWIKRSDIEEINFKRAFDCANKILQAGLIKNDIKSN